ncbi:unnamed protein product [Dovyalis caffra]|uniref:Uncharacterized protein n=1 Tax=Dovyalis caffra TaxID=77055 RepID=A0AAV1QY02_9ROSI|nr:unnamed protein product [Dovyalis caffra]
MISAKEFNPEAAQENTGLQNFGDAEETFSFCNLSLNNCDSACRDNHSKQDRQDFFQFPTEELASTASTAYSSDSIIFCGKVIPYKGEQVVAEEEQKMEIADEPKENTNKSMLPSKLSHSSSKSTERAAARSNASPRKTKQEKSTDHKDCENTDKGHASRKLSADKSDSSMRKESNLSSSMSSGRHSNRLGVGKLPTEMDLSDTKTRQSKRSSPPARMFSPETESGQKGKSSKGKREKGLCGLCRGKSSVDCTPPV